MQETKEMWIHSTGQEHPVGRKWQPIPVILPENLWTGEPGRLCTNGVARVGPDLATKTTHQVFAMCDKGFVFSI